MTCEKCRARGRISPALLICCPEYGMKLYEEQGAPLPGDDDLRTPVLDQCEPSA